MKICSKCKTSKDVSEFYKDKRNIDGLYSDCKTCHGEHTMAWDKNNPEVGRTRASEWNKKNKERAKENLKRYRDKKKLERIENYNKGIQ